MHLCFSRKNKTLSAIFKQKNVLELFEGNYKTFCSLNNTPVDRNFDAHKVVAAILERTGSAEKRSAKMDIDDFLKCVTYLALGGNSRCRRLLAAFNEAGIHFA